MTLVQWRLQTVLGAALVGLPSPSHAADSSCSRGQKAATRLQQKRLLPYPLEQVWPASIRYLRVDRGYTIIDQDPDNGFVLFSIPLGPEQTTQGSLEFVRTHDASGRPSVDVLASTDGGPTHLPFTLLDGVADKVRRERGQPAPPPPPTPSPPTPPPDDGEDDDLVLPPGEAPPQIPIRNAAPGRPTCE